MRLRILNETGHTVLEVNTEYIDDHPAHWVFVDGEIVSREDIRQIDWTQIESVDLTPAIVGGSN